MSKETSTKGQSIALAVVALLAGILVGVVGAHFFNISDETVTKGAKQETATNTAAAELRSSLDTRFVEHVYLTQEAMAAAYENDPSAEQRFTALETNTQELATTLGVLESVNEENSAEIGEEYANHVRTYAVALREQDQETIRQTQDQLDALSEVIAGALSEELDISEDELKEMLDTHISQMQQIFNAHTAENYKEAYETRQKARSHVQQLSQRLSAQIVDTYPEQYE